MIMSAFHQLRFVMSIAFGLRFDPGSVEHLVKSLRKTIDEFGSVGEGGAELINGVSLDAETQAEVQTRRLRAAARRAARTPYYSALLKQNRIDPRFIDQVINRDTFHLIPITRKNAVREHPDQFVVPDSLPTHRATTTGTTGKPTSIYFSNHEMRVYYALQALGALYNSSISPTDIIQISVSARGALGNVVLANGAAQIGALVYQTGVVDPEFALRSLAEPRKLPSKKEKTSILYTYPSYLGMLIEHGLAAKYRPSDFGLERIAIGGEIVTEGLKDRARELFGDVVFEEGYGITELWGMGGTLTHDKHLAFEIPHGFLEVLDPDTGHPATPGTIGTLVGTPFTPFRETTMLLRYDTEDLVEALPQIPGKQLCGNVLGKRRLAIRHTDGNWTTPRQVMEVLEADTNVPLPARFSLSADEDGVMLQVVTRNQDSIAYRRLDAALQFAGVPIRKLVLCSTSAELTNPYPLRGDLREYTFNHTSDNTSLLNTMVAGAPMASFAVGVVGA
jgi:phenylacetate-CoA ligase